MPASDPQAACLDTQDATSPFARDPRMAGRAECTAADTRAITATVVQLIMARVMDARRTAEVEAGTVALAEVADFRAIVGRLE